MNKLAHYYEKGKGVIKNDVKRFELYQKVVEYGNNQAFYGLEIC
jgi:TPR repeat protein